MRRDSIQNTLIVATALCVLCSVLVSAAAVGLRSIQQANKILDRNKNVILAAGLVEQEEATAEKVQDLFDKRIETALVNLETGAEVSSEDTPFDVEKYDARLAAKDPELSVAIPNDVDSAGIKRREKFAFVYKISDENNQLSQIVLPIYGKGLWSTLYGFLALESDANTVAGITFYEHGETPGLGGEVENEAWQSQWVEKSVYDEQGDVELAVIKGQVDSAAPDAKHKVDGLSGATITSNGVTGMIEFWLGPNGFGPYLDSLQQGEEEAGG